MSKLFLFPILVCVLCLLTFFGTNLGVVFRENIKWPYISEGGSFPPESCIFSQALNATSIILGIIFYIRYRQIEHILYHNDLSISVMRLNVTSLWIGLIACLGLSVAANFQANTMGVLHCIGAFSCFGLGTVYFWLQGFISYAVRPYMGSKKMTYVRFVIAVVCTCGFCITIFSSCQLTGLYHNKNVSLSCKNKRLSVSGEWITGVAFCFFILSFTCEFKTITLDRPIISVACKNDDIGSNRSTQNLLI